MGQEGCSKSALDSSDMAIGNIKSALELLVYTDRLKATFGKTTCFVNSRYKMEVTQEIMPMITNTSYMFYKARVR